MGVVGADLGKKLCTFGMDQAGCPVDSSNSLLVLVPWSRRDRPFLALDESKNDDWPLLP